MVLPGEVKGAASPMLVVKNTRRETMATIEITRNLFKISNLLSSDKPFG
jgi:hypothetical protein